MPRESRDRPIAGSKTLTRGGWLFLLGLLSGCASVSPDTAQAPADEVPVAWSGAPQGALDARNAVAANAAWWQGFGDPVLSQLVAQARQSNTSVVAAQAALQQARALRNVAAAGLQPSVGSSASAQHGTRGSQSTGNNFQAGLDASWEVDFFGARRSAVDTAGATARASAASLGDVQLSMAAETGLNYIALRSGQERLALALDNLAAQQQTRQITEWRAQAGLLSALETQ
ncbi:MAG: TolC family protein, partial [Rubrivivax sp.]|nr:TolC family protein [Rubrivivax sp.]